MTSGGHGAIRPNCYRGPMANRVFPAVLKYWRGRSGMSQLDLALAADVSSRHLSYLETGRAQPSESMVLRLMAALNVPLRHQNDALIAAGFAAHFPEPVMDSLPHAVQSAMDRMLQQQEPFPMTVLAADYRIVQHNAAALRVFGRFAFDPQLLATQTLDMFALILDPALGKPFVRDWHNVARHMLMRLQRELSRTGDVRLASLLDRAMQYPDVEASWRYPEDEAKTYSTLEVWLQRDELTLGFLTTLTAFASPSNVLLDELRLESYFPLNDATQTACERLAAESA
jgi:transcriptional regulator with XRE-family HTH domain